MTTKHWSKCSAYAVARAIAEQYNADWDQAFRLAWYGTQSDNLPTATTAQVFARMQAVENVPIVSIGAVTVFQFHLQRVLQRGQE